MTAEGRTTAARLVIGDKVRVTRSTRNRDDLFPTHLKCKGVEVATIESIEQTMLRGGRRATRQYILTTDLGTIAASSSQTFGLVQ